MRRPVGPPPPVPPLGPGPGSGVVGGGNLPLRMSNGRSTESISSVSSDMEQAVLGVGTNLHNPVPPPRKVRAQNMCRPFWLSSSSTSFSILVLVFS